MHKMCGATLTGSKRDGRRLRRHLNLEKWHKSHNFSQGMVKSLMWRIEKITDLQ